MEYLGEYKDGKKHGKGRYTWSDGGIYVGNGRMEKNMVKEHTLHLVEQSM